MKEQTQEGILGAIQAFLHSVTAHLVLLIPKQCPSPNQEFTLLSEQAFH